ncbi:MAG: hypothetical protein ACM335_00935 [Deltaproteobacteria bacterium]
MNRRERLKLAARILRKRAHEGESVTETFKSEYPTLADIMEEMLAEARVFLEMGDEEFKLDFLGSIPYDSFKVLIYYYAEQELKKGRGNKREAERPYSHSLLIPTVTAQ